MSDTSVYRSGRGHVVCDFCSSAEPVWRYHVGPAELARSETTSYVSRDDWLACDGCSVLIEAGNVEGLMDRAIAAMTELHGEVDRARATAIANVQLAFFTNRIGERQPFG